MPENKSRALKDWRTHPQDYILIRMTLRRASGEEITGHHIVHCKNKVSHIIEDAKIREALA